METNNKLEKQLSESFTVTLNLANATKALASFAGNLAASSQPTPITLTFNNITKVLPVPAKLIDPSSKERTIKRTLLNNISGQIHPKQLVALMGPSGSGKTTLLNTLSGRAMSGVTGQVYFNQQLYNKSMKRKLAYVLQQDTSFERLTVKQQLTYTALLRLPNHFSRSDKHAQVDNIIEQLRLQKCANTPIMLVSGGEKKRVNIGTELLTNPTVIFLDEPTSGLDSTTAFDLIEMLREVAMEGKTIITSIHQPSSQIFQSFDQLFLLADGQTIFMGCPCDALPYFRSLGHECPGQYNASDYVMDLVNRDLNVREELKRAYSKSRMICDKINQSEIFLVAKPSEIEKVANVKEEIKSSPSVKEPKWPLGFFGQLIILYCRSFRLTGKSQFTIIGTIQSILVAIIAGLCWFQMDLTEATIPDRASFLFFVITFWAFKTLMGGINSFPSERKVLEKERSSGYYRLSAYFCGKSLAESPLKLVLPTAFLTISYWMAGVSDNPRIFFGILGCQLLTILVAESLGLFLGAIFSDVQHAMMTGTIIKMSLMLLGGFYVQNIPPWLSTWANWLSYFRYAQNACLQLQFMGSEVYQCDDGSYVDLCRENPNGTFIGSDALKHFNIDLSLEYNFLVLFGMFVIFRFVAYLSLRFIKHRSGRS